MKTAVVYYSYTGRTGLAARAIAGATGGELRRIEEAGKRKGLFGFIRGAIEAAREKKADIKPVDGDFGAFDLVVVAGPMWAGKLPPALNAFLERADFGGKKVVGLCTFGGSSTEGFARILADRTRERNGDWAGFIGIKTGGAKNEEIIRQAEEGVKKYRAV